MAGRCGSLSYLLVDKINIICMPSYKDNLKVVNGNKLIKLIIHKIYLSGFQSNSSCHLVDVNYCEQLQTIS